MSSFTHQYLSTRKIQQFDIQLIEAKVSYYLLMPCFASKKDFIPIKTTKAQLLKTMNDLGANTVNAFINRGPTSKTNMYIASFVLEDYC